MAFVNYKEKDDMQDDTFKVVMQLIILCIEAQNDFLESGKLSEVKRFYSRLKLLHDTIWKRLGKDGPGISNVLVRCRNLLYHPKQDHNPEIIFESLQEVYRIITGILDDKGLLFKARADIDTMVAQ